MLISSQVSNAEIAHLQEQLKSYKMILARYQSKISSWSEFEVIKTKVIYLRAKKGYVDQTLLKGKVYFKNDHDIVEMIKKIKKDINKSSLLKRMTGQY